MAVKVDEIRLAAQRVAASHGLDVVDLEFAGPSKERILRVFLEKNAEGRARLKAEVEARAEGLPERLAEGKLGRLTAAATGSEGMITLDLSAVKQNSKSRKAGVDTVEIALANIEKAQLIAEI